MGSYQAYFAGSSELVADALTWLIHLPPESRLWMGHDGRVEAKLNR
jgi:hypothetical protein